MVQQQDYYNISQPFFAIFTDELIDYILDQSNKHYLYTAEQSITRQDFIQYISCLLLMCIRKQPNFETYFGNNELLESNFIK